jgi:tight adherence protein C
MQINQETLFIAGLFATGMAAAYWLSGLLLGGERDPIAERLRTPTGDEPLPERGSRDSIAPMITRLGEVAGKPFMPKDPRNQSKLRKQLMHAGIYSTAAMQVIVGMKVIGLIVGALAGYLLGRAISDLAMWMLLYIGALVGFLTPTLWLRMTINGRQRAIEHALPDVLDLMVVCVESGLTIDSAIQRVGHEIALAHPDLSRELGITHMETRVGVSRMDALRNLGQRTGSAALQSLSAMLVQTERFGTSIAQALRVHADSLRTKRQHAAEEQAAKTTVKLAFPVVLFIFPTLGIHPVLQEPAVQQITGMAANAKERRTCTG